MRSNYLSLVFVMLLTLLVGGCASFSNYQPAEVLDKDEIKFTVGLTFTNVSPEKGQELDYEDITYFTPELILRAGIFKNFDFGAKLYFSLPVGIVIDGKYQFLDTEKFDVAADIGMGYSGMEVDDTDLSFLDLYPALLMTYSFSDKFSTTLAPKVVYRFLDADNRSNTQTLAGATLTLIMGKRIRLIPEVGYYRGKDSFDQEVEFVHGGIGFGF